MTPFMITMLLSSIGVVLGGIGLYTWLRNQRRKRELVQADPTILELYQKLKKKEDSESLHANLSRFGLYFKQQASSRGWR